MFVVFLYIEWPYNLVLPLSKSAAIRYNKTKDSPTDGAPR